MTGIEALLYYLLWMILLTLLYAGPRIPQALLGKKPADHWTRGKSTDDAAFFIRASHAHANCVENFALFAAVVLVAAATQQNGAVDGLACYVLGARVLQSVVHLMGTSFFLVLMRATFFLVQVALVAYMAFGLLNGLGA
tara:strand:- start:1503 stop:1919 length:417 start_codon:yes stop_codon:yes gene_type:complete